MEDTSYLRRPGSAKQNEALRLALSLSPRQSAAGIRPPTALEEPQAPIALRAEELDEMVIADWFFGHDAEKRTLAIMALNDRMQRWGDMVTRHRTVRLAANTFAQDPLLESLPVAVEIGGGRQVDTRWLPLFNRQDRRDAAYPGAFRIQNHFEAVEVSEYLPGEAIRFGTVSAESEYFLHKPYAAALQWNELEMSGRWERMSAVSAVQSAYADYQGRVAYGVLTAPGATTVSYQTGASEVEKDIRTINEGVRTIRDAIYNTPSASGEVLGENVLETTTFYLLYNNTVARYEERVMNALGATFQVALGGGLAISEVRAPVTPLGTPNVPAGNWWIVLPGRKNVFSVLRDLRLYDILEPRIAGVGRGEVGQGAYLAVRGDVRQVAKLNLS